MTYLKTLDKETVENIFILIGMIPHYSGQNGKETIVIDDLLKAIDTVNDINKKPIIR